MGRGCSREERKAEKEGAVIFRGKAVEEMEEEEKRRKKEGR